MNAFKQALVGTYSDSDTVIELNSISDTPGDPDYLVSGVPLILYDSLFGNPADSNNAGDYEIVAVTGINYATNEITVTRAQENTTAQTISAGWSAVYGLTQAGLDGKVNVADIVNDLTTGGVAVPLSAEQGKELKTQLDAVGGGKILQVVSASTTTQKLISSTTLQDTNLTATITPLESTSTIFVIVNQSWSHYQTTNDARSFDLQLLRDSTIIFSRNPNAYGTVGTNGFFEGALDGSMSIEDTPTIPATPVAITYKTQSKVNNTGASTTSAMQFNGARSTITLIELKGE